MRILKRLIITPLVWLAAIVFLIEEFIGKGRVLRYWRRVRYLAQSRR